MRSESPPTAAPCQLVFALLCELADADSAAPALPPLVQAAVRISALTMPAIRRGGASERLGRPESHLVRTFTAIMGVPPGKYLTTVRIEAAQRLLLHRGVHAGRGGQPVRLFRGELPVPGLQKETGQSLQWRALTGVAPHSQAYA